MPNTIALDLWSIPEFGDPAALRAAANTILAETGRVKTAADTVKSTWGGLASHYHAPESAELLATVDPGVTDATSIKDDGTSMSDALTAFAGEIDKLNARKQKLEADAAALDKEAGEAADGVLWFTNDWRADRPDLLNREHALQAELEDIKRDWQTAQDECVDSMDGLFTTVKSRQGTNVPQVDITPEQAPPPPQKPKPQGWGPFSGEFLDDPIGSLKNSASSAVNTVVDVGKGFWDGGAEMVNGLADMTGLHGVDKMKETWGGMATLGKTAFTAINPLASSEDRANAQRMMVEVGKALIDLETWKTDPARAFGKTLFSVASLAVGGFGGAALKGATAGVKAASIADKASLAAKAVNVAEKVMDVAKSSKVATAATKVVTVVDNSKAAQVVRTVANSAPVRTVRELPPVKAVESFHSSVAAKTDAAANTATRKLLGAPADTATSTASKVTSATRAADAVASASDAGETAAKRATIAPTQPQNTISAKSTITQHAAALTDDPKTAVRTTTSVDAEPNPAKQQSSEPAARYSTSSSDGRTPGSDPAGSSSTADADVQVKRTDESGAGEAPRAKQDTPTDPQASTPEAQHTSGDEGTSQPAKGANVVDDTGPVKQHVPAHQDADVTDSIGGPDVTHSPDSQHHDAAEASADPAAGSRPAGDEQAPAGRNLTGAQLDDIHLNSVETPGGRAYYLDGDNTVDFAKALDNPVPGHHVVDMHGTPDHVVVGDKVLAPDDLAELLKRDPNYTEGQKVFLMSCETGQGDAPFASKLAQTLDTQVTAPDQLAWSDLGGGKPHSSSHGLDADNPTPDGAWHDFAPDGTRTESGYQWQPDTTPDHTTGTPDVDTPDTDRAAARADHVPETQTRDGNGGGSDGADVRATGGDEPPLHKLDPETYDMVRKPVTELTDAEIAHLKEVRSRFTVDAGTPMQKVLPWDEVQRYLANQPDGQNFLPDQAFGFTARQEDVAHLHTTEQIVEGLGLDYSYTDELTGEQVRPFRPDGQTVPEVYAMRYQQDIPENLYVPRDERFDPTTNPRHTAAARDPQNPYTGNGFTSGGVPEFRTGEATQLRKGATIVKFDADGRENLVAVLEDVDGSLLWRQVTM